MKLTIALALQELKRINKIIITRKRDITRYCSKMRSSKDEIEKQKEYVQERFQSIQDLLQRYSTIKVLIQKSNIETFITYNDKQYSIAEALLYKHYLAQEYISLYNCFNASNAQRQINDQQRYLSGNLSDDMKEKLDFVPELYYDERKIRQLAEELVGFISYADPLIDQSNHNTSIEI